VKKSITKLTLGVAAAALFGYLAWWIAAEYFNPEADPRSKEFLTKVAAEINRAVPVMIDPETELMTTVGSEGMLVYNYRLVAYSAAQLSYDKFREGVRQRVTQAACSTPETRDGLLKKGVTLRYSYFDKEKQPIASVDVTPADCGF
jgi:hypothetical protein